MLLCVYVCVHAVIVLTVCMNQLKRPDVSDIEKICLLRDEVLSDAVVQAATANGGWRTLCASVQKALPHADVHLALSADTEQASAKKSKGSSSSKTPVTSSSSTTTLDTLSRFVMSKCHENLRRELGDEVSVSRVLSACL
jgi:hypothetical protein